MPGRLFIIEGVDGSGKTTLIENMKRLFSPSIVLNFSYPKQSEMFASASYALGECVGALQAIEQFLVMGVNVFCDRFHLGEYAYGPVKRGYPEWLAVHQVESVSKRLRDLTLNGFLVYEIILLAQPEVSSRRIIEKGTIATEYLQNQEELRLVNERYECPPSTQANRLRVETDHLNTQQVLGKVLLFMRSVEQE